MGDQCWFAENINVGDRINGAVNQGDDCDDIEKYCYNDDPDNCDEYGALYQWNQAMCGDTNEEAQGICPDGWRLPSHDDWTTLEIYVCNHAGNDDCDTEFPYDQTTTGFQGNDEGDLLKASGYSNFCNDDSCDDNYNFTALPGGYRASSDSDFYGRNAFGRWWTSTERNATEAWRRSLGHHYSTVLRNNVNNKNVGFSVRCIKE